MTSRKKIRLWLYPTILLLLLIFIPFTFEANKAPSINVAEADLLNDILGVCITPGAGVLLGCSMDDVSEGCRGGTATCSERDQTIIKGLATFCSTLGSDLGTLSGCNDRQRADAAEAAELLKSGAAPLSCGMTDIFSLTCWGRVLSALIGTALITLTAWLLAVSGLLFDFFINATIVEFGSYFRDYLETGVNIGWTALRDIANILIIGMFTFIAISLILGIKEYGERKMIARVLIVAILLNFSLLFTKMIIDASNFTALQFYRAALPVADEDGPTGINPLEFSQVGIAGQFIKFMGVTSIGDTWNALSKTAFGTQSENYANAGGWKALLHGVFSATLLLTAALVFLYGVILLGTRIILLIFLLITAPLAFASWLIPKFAHDGWHKWWDSLLRSAVFAPLLLIFLWISLKLGENIKPEKGTLGDLITNPTADININSLFSYILVVGLLFASVRIASKFSGTIAGFGTALTAATLPLTIANRGAALVGRTWLGRMGARAAEGKEEALGSVRTGLAKLGPDFRKIEEKRKKDGWSKLDEKEKETWNKYNAGLQDATRLIRQKDRREGIAKSSFNAFNTEAGKAVAAGMGLTGFAAGGNKKPPSFAESAKAQAEKAAKTAAELSMSGSDKEKLQIKKEKELREAQKGREDVLKAARDNAAATKQMAEAAKQSAEAQVESQAEELKRRHADATQNAGRINEDATRRKDDIRTRYDAEIEALRKQVSDLRESGGNTGDLERTVGERVRTRDAQLKAEDDRINSARAAVETIQSRIDIVRKPVADAETKLKEAESALKKAEKDIGDFNENIVKDAKSAVEAIANQSKDVAKDVGAELAHQRWSNVIPRALGQSPENDIIARKARGLTGKKIGAKTIKAQEAARKEILDDAGEGSKGGKGEEKH